MQISDLNQLLKKYKSEIEKLEVRIKEKKERLNIVYEAMQLLQQEGVTESSFTVSSKTGSITEKYKGFSMNNAIFDILSHSDKYLSGQQIYDEMVKNGFESLSSDIKRDVYITMYRLKKEGKVITKIHENRKKYMVKQTVDDL
ncbi:MAG: hypothetical protein V3U40_02365 [Candidatus Scalindua sediminis]